MASRQCKQGAAAGASECLAVLEASPESASCWQIIRAGIVGSAEATTTDALLSLNQNEKMQGISLEDARRLLAAQNPHPPKPLLQVKAGKMTKAGKTVSAIPKKGLLLLVRSEGATHFQWKDRVSGNVVDDWVVFPGDAELLAVPQCRTGKVVLLQFQQSRRQEFFWLQEPVTDERFGEVITKANDFLNGRNLPAEVVEAERAEAAAGEGAEGGEAEGPEALLRQLTGGQALRRQQPLVLDQEMLRALLGGGHRGTGAAAPVGGSPATAAVGGDSLGTAGTAHVGGSRGGPIGEDYLRQVLGQLGATAPAAGPAAATAQTRGPGQDVAEVAPGAVTAATASAEAHNVGAAAGGALALGDVSKQTGARATAPLAIAQDRALTSGASGATPPLSTGLDLATIRAASQAASGVPASAPDGIATPASMDALLAEALRQMRRQQAGLAGVATEEDDEEEAALRLSLEDVLRPEALRAFLADAEVQQLLFPHMPEAHRNPEALQRLVESPQFAQQVQLFSSAAAQTAPGELLRSLGMGGAATPAQLRAAQQLFPEGAERAAVRFRSFIPAFLQAIQARFGRAAPPPVAAAPPPPPAPSSQPPK